MKLIATPFRLLIFRSLLALVALSLVTAVRAGSGFQSSDIARAVYAESQPDLRVKVMGGFVDIQRSFVDGQWFSNLNWRKLDLTFDNLDGSVKTIVRNGVTYEKTSGDVYTASSDFRTAIKLTASGFRWSDREGHAIDYDPQGNIVAYGDRNDVKVSFVYEAAAAGKRITSIVDHFGTPVLFFEYTGNQLTAVRDYTNRRVQYRYSSDGNINEVIDVFGNTWNYGYARSILNDVRCDVHFEFHNGNLEEVSRNCAPITIVEDKFRLVSVTDPESRTLNRQFSPNGFLGGFSYADGTKTEHTFDYDAAKRQHYVREKSGIGKITESWIDEQGDVIRKDLNGHTVSTLVKDTAGHTRTETDARGLQTVRTYDQWLNVTKIVYPDGTTITTNYDPVFSNVTQKIDEQGVITKYEYDAKGNLTRMTDALGLPEQRVVEYTYDQYGNRLSEKHVGDEATQDATTAFEYDNFGNRTAMIDPEGSRSEYSNHDVMGNCRTTRDARQKIWTKTYDSRGMLTSESDPLSNIVRVEYDRSGLRKKTIDAVNNETTYGYDVRGNLITISDPYGGVIRAEYDAENRQIKQTDQEGKSQIVEFDLDGRLSKQIDGNGNVVQYVYGAPDSGLDRLLVKIVYPTFSQEYKYDARSRIVETIDVLDVNSRFSNKTVYDARSNRTATTDKEGKTTTASYDALRRLTNVTDVAGGGARFTYDNRDNLIAVTDSKNQTNRFDYDRRNLKSREIRPLGQTTVYSYDVVGQLVAVSDARDQVKRYAYDDARRWTEENHFTAANAAPVKTIAYTYNNLGALTSYNDGTTQGTRNYDTRQLRHTGETVNYGAFSLSYSYDYYANYRKKSFTGPDGVTVSYTYDSNNQLSAVQLPIGNVTINSYQWNWPTQITLPGGTIRTQSYDPLMRLGAISVKDPGQNSVMSYQYAYDKVNNIVTKNTERGDFSYSYDNLYRLVNATNPAPLLDEVYTYDAAGNRLTSSSVPGAWQYNANDQLTQAGAGTVSTYDENGNMVTRTAGSTLTQYAYDIVDRLTEVRDSNNNLIAKYNYDPFGRRLWKEVNSQRTYFLYADTGLIAEANAGGSVTALYGYRSASAWSGDPIFLKTDGQYYFFENDHLGTPQKLVTVNGAVAWSASMQAFGRASIDPASTITNNLRFAGQYFDQETGLHYNYQRYYDPSVGRYVESDPIGLKGGINRYAYTKDNPTAYVDPLGLAAYVGFSGSANVWGLLALGGGYSEVVCKDECQKLHVYRYVKVCAGISKGPLPVSASAVAGVVSNMDGNKCVPDNYSGYFLEFSGGFGVAGGGCDIGLTQNIYHIPNGFSGVNECGAGLSTPGGSVMLCYYFFIGER